MKRVMMMYRLFVDSLMNPKALLEYRNKSGWFSFAYLMILVALMSISAVVYLAGYPWANPVTSEQTGCTLVNQSLVCEDATNVRMHTMFGLSVYFFNVDETIPTTIDNQSLVVQGDTIRIQSGGAPAFSVSFARLGATSFDSIFSELYAMIRISILVFSLFQNGIFFLMLVLISTMSVLRLRQFIPFKKLFRLILFASTTMAVLITFYNLLPVPEWVMFLVLIVGIRPHFLLQKELTLQTMIHLQETVEAMQSNETAEVKTETDETPTEESSDPSDDESD
jgi:hypothetical protein